jgi:hypothetical protein
VTKIFIAASRPPRCRRNDYRSKAIAAEVMALTPVRSVGSGSGSKRLV